MTRSHQRTRVQNFAQAIGETRSVKDFAEEQKGGAGIGNFGDGEKRPFELSVGGELVSAGIQPGVYSDIGGAQFGLQFAREARGIAHQETGVDAEETGKELAGSAGHVRACAVFDLRKIRLAEAAAEFVLHCRDDFGLGHGAVEAAKRALDDAEGAELVAESHGAKPFEYCDMQNVYCNM